MFEKMIEFFSELSIPELIVFDIAMFIGDIILVAVIIYLIRLRLGKPSRRLKKANEELKIAQAKHIIQKNLKKYQKYIDMYEENKKNYSEEDFNRIFRNHNI